eukprot:751573-Hanusia_phi.AAC.1
MVPSGKARLSSERYLGSALIVGLLSILAKAVSAVSNRAVSRRTVGHSDPPRPRAAAARGPGAAACVTDTVRGQGLGDNEPGHPMRACQW